jgi:hypothetical protein
MGLPGGRPISRVGCYAVFLRAFAVGFGSILFWDLAFSFAANSCLTLRAMASVAKDRRAADRRRLTPYSENGVAQLRSI